jgi:hypothetical protein
MKERRGQNTLKTYNSYLYSWSPDKGVSKNAKQSGVQYYCTATPFSLGQDWISTYCYNLVVVDGEQQRLAYVACDYVQ